MNTSYDSDGNGSSLTDKEEAVKFNIRTEEIYFADQSNGYYCVCFVDIVNSSQITARIAVGDKIKKYYEIFLNAMAALAKNFGAKVIKNIGDALLFYFPDTSDSENMTAFKEVLECCTAIIAAHEFINIRLESEALPPVSYRISVDYGRVEVATTVTSGAEDLFGPTVNMCAKINSQAEPNGIVIGGDLHEMMKRFSFKDYSFEEVRKKSPLGIKYSYPVYSVVRKDEVLARDSALNVFRRETLKPKFGEETLSIDRRKALQPRDDIAIHSYPKQTSHPTIMIVDDEPDTLLTYEWFLSDEGYNVEAFTDPQEALKRFVQFEASSYYQLVLLDIRMPRLNGLQLFNTIKAISPATKIMFVSALDIAEELTSMLPDIKYEDIIKKPVEREYFISKINSILKN